MKFKRLSALLLAVTMTISLVACGNTEASAVAETKEEPVAEEPVAEEPVAVEPVAEEPAVATSEPVTLVYAEVNPEDSLMGKTAAEFKANVEKLTNGSVTVDVQYGGVLGAEGDVLDAMIGGGGMIDVARISTSSLSSYGVKLTKLLSVPYLFENRDHFWNYAKSDIGAQVLQEPSELGLGVHGMFYVEEGFRHFFFKDEVTGLADLAGRKIRVSTDPVMMGMVEGLGASPTEIAFTELYSSLSSGVVDGAEQPIANYQSNAFGEVAPYMILDGHTLGCGEVIICDASWDKLDDAQKAAVEEASNLTSEFNAGLSEENENKCKEELIASGVTFVDVADLKEWQDACADIVTETIAGLETEVESIRAMAK